MAENSSTIGSSTASAPARSDDPAWAHARVVPEARNNTIYLYCNKLIIIRLLDEILVKS